MLLLDQGTISASSSLRGISIVSEREEIQSEIAQILRTNGLENIKLINEDFLSSADITFSAEDSIGVIIDINKETNVSAITKQIFSAVPQNMWCCVVGDSDSISLAQKLLEDGILYFNSYSQLNQMVNKIVSGISIPKIRDTVKIAVLGCKGGIGSSLISAHIANEISTNKKVPVLLSQGPNGSQDLDLLFDKKLQGSIIEYSNNLDLYIGDLAELSPSITDKYNFVIYDQPIFNVKKDNLGHYFDAYSNFLLVVERKVGSLRIAKQFLDECERIKSATGRPIRTFVCISDHSMENSKLMAKIDIEALLRNSVDAVIPFLKNTNTKNVLSIDFGRNGKKEINDLMMKIIGAISRNTKSKDKQGLFGNVLKKLVSN